ncbi:hypothetical protein BO221_42100 [Archangium sp. Cb G35]|uniref:hypothetical protein n=1 Tax=Archangium sp. Cb G35 TaxID=1920190 RepID=UPI000937BE72|nr:hypothetical protein [Archangium sp. Cb G35]OJT18087.1 hypothetical protein BO221_42100 [Archangium sp. Cb G35]
MIRRALRSLSVVVGLSFSWALPALAADPAATLGSLECEGIRELQALVNKQQSILTQNNAYAANLTELLAAGYMPAACPDGSRVRVSGSNLVGGCHFTYGLVSVVNNPRTGDFAFEAVALGVAGTPSAGLELYITRIVSRYHDFTEAYMYRKGVYSDVDLNACSRAE